MAYSKSKARLSLENNLDRIVARTRLAEIKVIPVDVREYVIAASIFLSHAELENYIADVFSLVAKGAVDTYMAGSPMPKELRAHLFLTKSNLKSAIGKYLGGSAERDLIKSVRSALDGEAVKLISTPAAPPLVSGKDIYGTIKYPSEENIKKLFFRLGMDNIFNELGRILKQDAAALLESLGSLRTQLAHTGVLPGISAKDIRNRIGDTLRFAAALDRALYSFLCRSYSQQYWNTHLK